MKEIPHPAKARLILVRNNSIQMLSSVLIALAVKTMWLVVQDVSEHQTRVGSATATALVKDGPSESQRLKMTNASFLHEVEGKVSLLIVVEDVW